MRHSTHTSSSVLLFAVTTALWLGGCSDKKKDKEKSSPATKVASIEGLKAIPASATAVVGIDVAKLSSSPVVLRAVERMFARDETLKADLMGVFGACEFDFKTDFVSATIAIIPRPIVDGGEALDDSLLVAKGRFNESSLSACLGRFLSDRGARLESSEVDGRRLYHEVPTSKPRASAGASDTGASDTGASDTGTSDTGTSAGASDTGASAGASDTGASDTGASDTGRWFAFGSADTLLVSSGRAVLVSALGDGPKLAGQKTGLARLISKAKLDAGVWGIAEIDGMVADGMVAATEGKVAPAKSLVGYAELEEGLSLVLKVEMADEKDAKVLISIISDQLAFAAIVLQVDSAGRLVEKIEVSSEGNWAHISWFLTENELADLMGSNLLGNEPDELDENALGNDLGDGSTIDIPDRNDENPALAPVSGAGQERETKNGKHTDSDRKKEFRKQSKAHQ